MEEIKLDVQIREEVGKRKIKAVRRQDFVPAVVYGGSREPTAIKVDRRAFQRIRRMHHGEIVFHLNVLEGEKKLRDYSAIVKEEQHDPVNEDILHIDFKRISLKEEIEVKVPIVSVGEEPVGVKKDGGSLEHVLWELDVVCLPTNIPPQFEIDVSHLEIGKSVHVSDIQLPVGVKTKHDLEAIVFTVAAPKKEEPEEVVAEGEEGAAEPEVIKEKEKKEEAAEEQKPAEGEEKKEESS